MSVRIAKVDQDPVSHVLGDVSTELAHGLFGAGRIGGKYVSQILGVHSGGQGRRSDQISEHHRDLAAFGAFKWARPEYSTGLGLGGKLSDQTEDSATIAQQYAEFLEIFVRKIR